jgi:hypothetical protein
MPAQAIAACALHHHEADPTRATQNLVKGYISRERGIVVLSKGGSAFPGTGV